jgi:hypothetical protein
MLSVDPAQKGAKPMTDDQFVKQELLGLEQEVGRAISRLDRSALDRLLADEFVGITTQAQVLTKAQILASLTPADYQIESFVNEDITVTVYGEMAVARARGIAKGRYKGKDTSEEFRYMRVWIKRYSRWQAVAAQSTALPK